MDWIRVTPETMPPDMEPVLVTAVRGDWKGVIKDCVWDKKEGLWGCADKADCIVYLDDDLKVTHWMPYPEPAEDCKTEEDCIPTPNLIDATTSQDINSGRYPVYVLGFGVSEDDLTDDERKLWEQSKRWSRS